MSAYIPRLAKKYKEEVVPYLTKKFNYRNIHEVPKLVKISLNMGVGEAVQDTKHMETAVENLATISGQKPAVRAARKSISNFKLRQGMKVGCMVTLRSKIMYEFFDRLVAVAAPRVRDFRGYSDKSFDGRGNYSMGVREQIIFPEINVDKIDKIRGLDITFVTTAKTDEEAYELLLAMGFPFKKNVN